MINSDTSLQTIGEIKKLDHGRGDEVQGAFVLKKKATKQAKNGSSYLSLEYGDKSGNFHCFCFGDNPLSARLESIPEGKPVFVQLITGIYQGRFSPKLVETRVLTDEELSVPGVSEKLVETCLENPEELWADIQLFISEISNDKIRQTVENALGEIETAFRSTPAAISMHHAYRHGLLEHTTHMARNCKALLPLYPEVHADLAMAGIILHDIGKVIEYEGELSVSKSRSGILQGHVVLGYRMVRKAGMIAKLEDDLLERLEHIVLSHQGELEWGAASMAATPEAVFVSMIDNLDARMGMVQYAVRHATETKPFSDYLPGLKAPLLTTPIAEPESPADLELE